MELYYYNTMQHFSQIWELSCKFHCLASITPMQDNYCSIFPIQKCVDRHPDLEPDFGKGGALEQS